MTANDFGRIECTPSVETWWCVIVGGERLLKTHDDRHARYIFRVSVEKAKSCELRKEIVTTSKTVDWETVEESSE
jgi:hypothetical protein